jgi:hypothetical protein
MPLPFWPKTAAATDAPNYRESSNEDKCETCAYYRALNDDSGYCERFSFQCNPSMVCDDFVAAGRLKSASARGRYRGASNA